MVLFLDTLLRPQCGIVVQVGSKITTGVDTFSFGIMMWELYTGQRAYSGLGRDAIIDRVYKKQSRPVFPSGVPALYSHLAQSCWETDVLLRPNFRTIIERLNEMLHAFQSGTYAGAGAAADAVRERLQQTNLQPNSMPAGGFPMQQVTQMAGGPARQLNGIDGPSPGAFPHQQQQPQGIFHHQQQQQQYGVQGGYPAGPEGGGLHGGGSGAYFPAAGAGGGGVHPTCGVVVGMGPAIGAGMGVGGAAAVGGGGGGVDVGDVAVGEFGVPGAGGWFQENQEYREEGGLGGHQQSPAWEAWQQPGIQQQQAMQGLQGRVVGGTGVDDGRVQQQQRQATYA